MRYALILAGVLLARALDAQENASPPAAPLPAAAGRAAELITTEELGRHVAALTADSLKERGTPSRGLDRAAQYVAGQFTKLGLALSLQSYRIPGSRRMDLAASRLFLVTQAHAKSGALLLDEWGSAMTKSIAVNFAGAVRPGVSAMPEGEGGPEQWGWLLGVTETPTTMKVVSGRHTAASIERADLRQQEVVMYVPPAGIDSAAEQQVIDRLRKSSSVLVLSADDSATFTRRRRAAGGEPPVVIDAYAAAAMGVQRWVAYVRADVLQHFWSLGEIDLARARADTEPTIRQLPALSASLGLRADSTGTDGPMGVNVVGVLPGADARLAGNYVLFTAHLDNGRHGQDDAAASIAALLALAKAYSQPGARPRRSLVFVATSGATDGQPGLGANFFAQSPPVAPIGVSVVLDDIGHGPRDSVVIDGLVDADFAARPDWVALNHPELGLAAVDGGTISDPALEHFAFVRRAIPTLAFHGAPRDFGVNGADASAVGELGKAASVTRLVYFVGQELAGAARRPKWSTLGRRYRLSALEQ